MSTETKKRTPLSLLVILSFVFFIISLIFTVIGSIWAFLPVSLFGIGVGIGAVYLALLSLREV